MNARGESQRQHTEQLLLSKFKDRKRSYKYDIYKKQTDYFQRVNDMQPKFKTKEGPHEHQRTLFTLNHFDVETAMDRELQQNQKVVSAALAEQARLQKRSLSQIKSQASIIEDEFTNSALKNYMEKDTIDMKVDLNPPNQLYQQCQDIRFPQIRVASTLRNAAASTLVPSTDPISEDFNRNTIYKQPNRSPTSKLMKFSERNVDIKLRDQLINEYKILKKTRSNGIAYLKSAVDVYDCPMKMQIASSFG